LARWPDRSRASRSRPSRSTNCRARRSRSRIDVGRTARSWPSTWSPRGRPLAARHRRRDRRRARQLRPPRPLSLSTCAR